MDQNQLKATRELRRKRLAATFPARARTSKKAKKAAPKKAAAKKTTRKARRAKAKK